MTAPRAGTRSGGASDAGELENRFQQLAGRWRVAVAPLSSVSEITQHPPYQEIIHLGPEVVPLIFREMERSPDHWFAALRALTGAEPVEPEDRRGIDRMTAAWLRWGKESAHDTRTR